MRRIGIELIYSLWVETRRMWQRYIIGNPKFILRVLRERCAAVIGSGSEK